MKVGDLVMMRGEEVFGNNTVSWSKGILGVVLSLRSANDRCYIYWFDGSKAGWMHKHWVKVINEGR